MTEILIEAAGWTGAVLVLGAYVLVTLGKLSGQSAAFQAMNLVGAAGFVVNTWWHGAIPSMVLNIIWAAIGLIALGKMTRRPK